MEAEKFLKEWKRMCESMDQCANCKAFRACPFPNDIFPYCQGNPTAVVPVVEQWSAAHPVKTYLTDFLEKHPNAHLRDGYPQFAPWLLGYCQDCGKCGAVGHEERFRECWNQPLE